MSGEVFQINVEADLERIDDIFDDPIISRSYEKACKETEALMRKLIVEYRDILLTDPEFKVKKKCIPLDDELILSKFKRMLRGQILAMAISNVFTELKLDLKKNILELTKPVNMIPLFSDVLEIVFTFLINEALFDDDGSQNTLKMLS